MERETDYYCLKDDALFDKQSRQEIHPQIYREETESDYEEAKRRFRANMKGLLKKTDKDIDGLIGQYEKNFAEEALSPFRRIATLESLQELEMRKRGGGAVGVGFIAGGIIGGMIARSIVSAIHEQPVPLRGSLTTEQEELTRNRLNV